MQIPIRKTLRRKGIRQLPISKPVGLPKLPTLNTTGQMVKTGKIPKFKFPSIKIPKIPGY